MDVMELRRRLLQMAVANGADYVKGTFTAPSSGTACVLSFGKTFQKYFYYVEMTDASKEALMDTNTNAYRAYCLYGVYPAPSIDGYSYGNQFSTCRINPSTKTPSLSNNGAQAIDETSITFPNYAVTATSTNSIYAGYSYKYYVVEIKD